MTESKSPLAAGIVVADTYDVERLLGKGGMGEVWLARHMRLAGKQVAIKVLHAVGANPSAELLARFRREAEIAARLDHPNIVQVMDFNQLPTGEPYLVMEFLKGESLADRARSRGGSLPTEQVQAIVLQVGSALQAAHAAGVVHRDLKPDNIFLVPTALGDQVKVLDFGISKLAQASTMHTTEQTLLGTPLYMSPEQALGQNRDTNGQSDLFSLGSICYELLTGTAPFVAESIAQVVFRIAYQPHLPLEQLMPSLPQNVVNAIEHALIKDRAARTPDIATFIRELTGEELATDSPRKERESSGVYSPGMRVSDSLLVNRTVSRVPSVKGVKATPVPLVNVFEAKPKSGALTFIAAGSVLVAMVAVAGFIWERSHLKPQAPLIIDAGSGIVPVKVIEPPPVVLPPVDAGAPVTVDAGAPVVVHARKPPQPVRTLDPKLSAVEKRTVGQLLEWIKAGNLERIEIDGMTAFSTCRSDACKRDIALIRLEAVCKLKDLAAAGATYGRLTSDHARAKTLCRQYMPGFDPAD